MAASTILRWYLSAIAGTGYTYGALATPIAFPALTFFLGFAVVLGAEFNATIQEFWPAGRPHGAGPRLDRRAGCDRCVGRSRTGDRDHEANHDGPIRFTSDRSQSEDTESVDTPEVDASPKEPTDQSPLRNPS
ncbi:hypothetical protein GS937_13845 [Rhodococcus hoagii]|nr:hypothetical protein [Prescottella equi]